MLVWVPEPVLPDRQHEFVVMAAIGHFVGSDDDGRRHGRLHQAEFAIDAGAGSLDRGQGMDQFAGHAFAGNGKVLECPLCLRAPQAFGGDLDVAEGVVFKTGSTTGFHRMLLVGWAA